MDLFLNNGEIINDYLNDEIIEQIRNFDLYIFIIVIIAFFVIKYLISILTQFMLIKYTFDIQFRIENLIYKVLLFEDYKFHLEKNTAQFIRDIQNCSTAYPRIISSIIVIYSEVIMIFMIISLVLLYSNLEIIYLTLIFIPFVYLFLKFTKNFIFRIGSTLHNYSKDKIETIKSSLDGILEVKVFQIESNIIQIFKERSKKTILALMKLNQIQVLPKYVLELFLIIIVIFSANLMYINGEEFNSILTFLALLIASAFRILPSISKIINSSQMINFNLPTLPSLSKYFDFKSIENDKETKYLSFESLELRNIDYSYPNSTKKILKNINFKIFKSSKIVIFGESGSGKSTFIKLITGLLKPDAGQIYINQNKNINHDINTNLKFSYVPQNVYLFDDTILNNIVMMKKNDDINKNKLSEILELLDLSSLLETFPNGLNTFVGENGARISGGQKQRIGIARSLYNEPDLLILDEATNSIDSNLQELVIERIFKRFSNLTIICISHDKEVIKKFDEKYKFYDGSLKPILNSI